MENINIIFLTFADKRYLDSLHRLKQQTKNFNFSERFFYTEDDLPEDFFKKYHYRIYRRGFCYWRWKSYLIKLKLKEMNDGDILLYSDAGCHFNEKGLSKFDEYIKIVTKSSSGVLAFEQPFLEKDYTKGDLFDFLDCRNDEMAMTLQLWGGAFFLRKCENTLGLIDQWDDICQNHFDLLSDRKSDSFNYIGFIEHRHDQSIFSLLAKKMGAIIITFHEGSFSLDNDWTKFGKYPILAKRTKSTERSRSSLFYNIIHLLYRFVIAEYLVIFKHFHFGINGKCY